LLVITIAPPSVVKTLRYAEREIGRVPEGSKLASQKFGSKRLSAILDNIQIVLSGYFHYPFIEQAKPLRWATMIARVLEVIFFSISAGSTSKLFRRDIRENWF